MYDNHRLNMMFDNDEIAELYTERLCNKQEGSSTYDSGVDLYFINDVTFSPNETKVIGLGVKCEMLENTNQMNEPFYLYARSSICKTPLILANGVGIIDSSYRGEIKAALMNTCNVEFVVTKGTRLVQICARDLGRINVFRVLQLTETSRGENGFGSTNN